MKNISCIFLLFFCLLSACTEDKKQQSYVDYVDPLIGSGGHGHVFVGASVPFGAVQLGPTNFYKGWDWCSGYHYGDSMIIGFSHLHLSGTGIGDLSDVLIMPYMGEVKLDKGIETERFSGYASLYHHSNETAKVGYYQVLLEDYGINVELTASERVGFHRYTFPKDGENARIIIDLREGINDRSTDTYIKQLNETTFVGYRKSSGWAKRQMVYFALKSSQPITNFSIYDDKTPVDGKEGQGKAIRGLFSFDKAPDNIEFKVGISPVSTDGALANIDAEVPHWDFEKVRTETVEKWNKELAKIEIETKDEAAKKIFYTSMFHAMIHPTLFNDHNGDYCAADSTVYKDPGFQNYSIFSTWDTYRAAHPLYTITNPDKVGDFVNSMLDIFDKTGQLPIWHLMGWETGTMVGISSFEIIAEAYLKGCTGFDAERAFNALKTTAMSDIRGLNYVRDLKAIPSDAGVYRPVAHALEFAIGDASIALMAKKMGKQEDYEYFSKRAENYKLYYDSVSGFMRGKMMNGEWNPVFDPLNSMKPWSLDFAEGNSWQYLWLVPQDVEGLVGLMGGEEKFINRLDTFFVLEAPADKEVLVDLTGSIGQYAHGNEPSHHIIYMYSYVGQQWKTAEKARYIMNEFYTDKPDGLIGNEDCGQMSAWYILSSLGFYPVSTASGDYVLGSPLFDKATINLQNGKKFTVETVNNSPDNIYIQSVELNNKEYSYSFITHDDIINGGLLKITMGSTPNYDFGKEELNRPKSKR